MAELGPTAADVHAAAGREARLAGVTRLFAVGAPCRETVAAFGAGGEWFSDVPAMIERLLAVARHDASILVKGSRVNRLERVVDALTVRLPDMPTSAAVS